MRRKIRKENFKLLDSDKNSLIIDIKYDSITINDENTNFTTATITATDGSRKGGAGSGERENEKENPRETSDIQSNWSSHTD